MQKIIFIGVFALVLIGLSFFGNYWFNTQPIWVLERGIDQNVLNDIPIKNQRIINFIEANGKTIAPDYNDVVCTEFVIKVIDKFSPLTPDEKNGIRILTNDDLGDLIKSESPVIKGVQTALVSGGKGTEIKRIEDVKPGDFVQFWNLYQGKEFGHCGIVLEINPNETLTLYSSHPLTNGFGRQVYLWPDNVYFVRLR
jgi:hypothetical protein